jgi:CheY-like chemotaxis protein
MRMPERILLVDDDVDDQHFFCEALGTLHPAITCEIANDGVEAMEMLEHPPLYDLIFLDLNMPRMDGFEFLNRVKTNDRFRNIPVVVISTSNRPSDIEKSMSLGAATYVNKPPTYDQLFHKLKNIFSVDLTNDWGT